MSRKTQVLKYLLSDVIGSILAWTFFFVYGKCDLDSFSFPIFFGQIDAKYYLSTFIISLFWVTLYYIFDFYEDIFRKSRLIELGKSVFFTILGNTVIFFIIIQGDYTLYGENNYRLFFTLNACQFLFTYPLRFALTSRTIYNIHNRKWGFNSVIIGSDGLALKLYEDIEKQEKCSGNKIIGFVNVQKGSNHLLEKQIPCIGNLGDLGPIIEKYKIEEVLIAIEPREHEETQKILNKLLKEKVIIKAIPDIHDMLTGKVKMSTIFDTPLIQISHDIMPLWQKIIKKAIDLFVAATALILFSPLCLILMLVIKWTSKGSVIYKHERIGKHGKPFMIYKFRSMRENSEPDGPALSCKGDPRITPIGRYMRKSRLDEIPNFINVLKGDMSLVGPRPERQYFIDKIMKEAPHYAHLQKIKPGITSWGQVKYGYAENVDQMVERLKYDILYLENMSLYVDFKIIIYTLITVIKGKGL